MQSPHLNGSPINRRRLLRSAAGAVVGAAVGSPFVGAGTASATVADSGRFDFSGAGGNPVWKKPLWTNWVMQSFAFDNINQHIYFLQCSPNKDAVKDGDMWITKTDVAGNRLESMAVHGFGHGVSIAVDPVGSDVYLWTEWMASESGFGTRIGRFKFVHGTVLERNDSSIQDRTPTFDPNMLSPQPIIDSAHGRLLVRYKVDADMPRIVAFDLSDARAGRLSSAYRLAERALPSRGSWGKTHSFQGFAAYGRYVYLLEGGDTVPSYLTAIDLNDTGQSTVEDKFPTRAGESLSGREPQGMAYWNGSSTGSAVPRLAFGFHSNTNGSRHASVFYKSQFH